MLSDELKKDMETAVKIRHLEAEHDWNRQHGFLMESRRTFMRGFHSGRRCLCSGAVIIIALVVFGFVLGWIFKG